MAGNAAVQFIGLPQILKKLDAVASSLDAQSIVSTVGPQVYQQFIGQFPASWAQQSKTALRKGRSAYLSQTHYQSTANSARITAPIIPEIYFERGSSRGTGFKGKRVGQHKRKTAAQFKSGNNFIKGRRYQARTRAFARKLLKQAALKLRDDSTRAWGA